MQERVALMMLRDRSGSNGGPEPDIFAAVPMPESVRVDRPAQRGDIEDCP